MKVFNACKILKDNWGIFNEIIHLNNVGVPSISLE